MNLHKQRCFAQASNRDRQAQRVPRPEGSGLGVALPRGGGLCEGVSGGGFTPGGFFRFQPADFSGGFFWRIFPLYFATKKIHRKNPPLRGEFLFQKSPGLEAPEIHRPFPPPQGEQIQVLCVSGLGTVTFQGGSFQEKTPGLIGPRNLRILIGRIAVGWPCMECHVPCHISIYWVWDSVKQSEAWGKKPGTHSKVSNKTLKKFY